MCAASGLAEVLTEKPFEILFSNFGNQEKLFPKGMVFSHANKHPLALVPIGEEVGREIAQCLQISGPAEVTKKKEEQKEESKKGKFPTSARDWEK